MCSIFGILDIKTQSQDLRELAIEQSKKQRHRGPDWSGIWTNESAILVHERLAIVDIDSGEQPLVNDNKDLILLVNGEIYNHKALEVKEVRDYQFQTKSDCEIILGLYAQDKKTLVKVTSQQIEWRLNQLEGMFAFILFDEQAERYLVARDPIGIIPLYYGYDSLHQLYVASEMKSLVDVCQQVFIFPPGHYLDSDSGEIKVYYQPAWKDKHKLPDQDASPKIIHDALVTSVTKHLMSDVPYGVLLSGGLDSSVISAIAQINAAKRIEDDQRSPAWWPQLHSFAVGLKGSPDLIAAQKVADHIGTIHHEIHFTVQQGIDALSEVIYHLETYDVTTIRAATPMYLMARKIKSMGIKMVLSGEGADEIFGGYLYFHKAPNAKEFHQETLRKLEKLHQFDCLRANKAMAAWGIEARVPFLDRRFLETAMTINPQLKMCGDVKRNGACSGSDKVQDSLSNNDAGKVKIEKHLLRQAFEGYLPNDILWRQKEQFSDGVGYGWIDSLKEYTESKISDTSMLSAAVNFPNNTPESKEAMYYRQLFAAHFPLSSAAMTVPSGKSIACSTKEALLWDQSFMNNADPSGRSVIRIHGADS